jgi:hypothetical protein
MVYFKTKNPNLGEFGGLRYGKFWYILLLHIWIILRSLCRYIVWPFGNFVLIWYVIPHFGTMYPEKIWQPCYGNEPMEGLVSWL